MMRLNDLYNFHEHGNVDDSSKEFEQIYHLNERSNDQTISFLLDHADALVPVIDSAPRGEFLRVMHRRYVLGCSFCSPQLDFVNFSLDVNGAGGDDTYVITRYQYGDVNIEDSLGSSLFVFDSGVVIVGGY